MPLYSNTTNNLIVAQGNRFEAGEQKSLEQIINPLPVGLVMLVTNSPAFDNVILSAEYVASQTINIPTVHNGQPMQNYRIRIWAESGKHQIQWNNAAAAIMIVVSGEVPHEIEVRNRAVDSIILTVVSAGTLKVDVVQV